jgi:hypothetical protein
MDVLPLNSDLSKDILMSEQEETEIEGVYLKRSGFFELMHAFFFIFMFIILLDSCIDFQVQAETRFS